MLKHATGEFNVWIADEREMWELGKKWLKDDKFHEVISWPLENDKPDPDGIWRMGDVAVWEKAKNRDFLIQHGIQHLMGLHHE